ncbi:type II toxin-antitoxin system Phd/YefM family antitoxin [Synechococcus sp. RS9909]|uniref:type II toxin-antitoxin system Phd/YefM family antitoxin n=2 Tax=unclassified Synechococcus TaxID=2626047 RepID=UPI00351BFC9E
MVAAERGRRQHAKRLKIRTVCTFTGAGTLMDSLGSEAARRRLPELLHRAEQGESILIRRRGQPVAALVPAQGGGALQTFNPGLLALRGSGSGCWDQATGSSDAADVVHKLRSEWD